MEPAVADSSNGIGYQLRVWRTPGVWRFGVGICLPTVEVRFRNVTVEAERRVGNRALPTIANTMRNIAESMLGLIGIKLSKTSTLTILDDASGIIKPSRMTLLLGPPSSGKTTLLLALAGRLDSSVKVSGEITYNGYQLEEFVPQKTAAYISQHNAHIGVMTVKETLDFSARCQGVGSRYDLLRKLAKKEKEARIFPDAEVDLYMKATAMEGLMNNLQTDYTMRILGLDSCADTIVGDEMQRGISGGQKKRVTTGEMMVGPAKTLFMDEISTGLDSSTTFQIVKCLQQIVHLGEGTILMSLLQPAPETFELFDDIIFLSEGQIIYQGPRDHVMEFFESCGFHCPERKGTADFLQEVTSRKDQEQYWMNQRKAYRYISVSEFSTLFKRFHAGQHLLQELSIPFDKNERHKATLVFSKYSVAPMELLRASFAKEWLILKRNSFVYIFKTVQLIIVGVITSTVLLRTQLQTRTEEDGHLYIAALIFILLVNMFNGAAEASFVMVRLPVFYKQRDLLLYPPWIYTLPNFILRIPLSLLESVAWVAVTYFSVGFAPEASRFFKQALLVFLIQQMAAGIFRAAAGLCRSMTLTNALGCFALLFMLVLGGFIIPRDTIPKWCIWGYWSSPLSYAYTALAVNEMFSPRWMNKFAPDGRRLGVAVLDNADIFTDSKWYWIGAAALLGFTIFFNMLFTFSLMYLNPLRHPQAIVSEDPSMVLEANRHKSEKSTRFIRSGGASKGSTTQILSVGKGNKTLEMMGSFFSGSPTNTPPELIADSDGIDSRRSGMVLPFSPLSMSFENVNYYIDLPAVMQEQGVTENRIQLLRGVTGAFRPGVLTTIMGVSGAGKTTLMDVLAGRKTGGYIDGNICVSGYPKNQATFARVSGYCEQTDIHSPQITVWESLIFSAFLRLPKEVTDEEKMKFVDEVTKLVELHNLKDALVGLPGVTGLSTEQRKRLTVAVELVANPSIIFMDEPTSGLDARAAAIVIRTVRNTVDTGRTVVCTIHQPSIDIFESFDELLLLKRGGQVIYSGSLGQNSRHVVEYFEGVPGVPKIKDKYNPATWMLEATSGGSEARLGIDFAEYYKSSSLFMHNKEMVEELSKPLPGKDDLYFEEKYSQSIINQFRYCLWKQQWTYWRSPEYNLARLLFSCATSLLFGAIFWQVGKRRESSTDLGIIIKSLYTAVLFIGVINCITVQPLISVERTVFYRERAAGMYSALPYAFSLMVLEIPYVVIQTLCYAPIMYSMMGFQWTAVKFLWFLFISFLTFLFYTYYGMVSVAITPNLQAAGVFSAAFFSLFNLFSGFLIPKPRIPKWWIWYYWICPLAYTVYGLIVTQYGDLDDVIKVPGQPDQTIKSYVDQHFGYNLDFMGVVAGALVGFTVLFGFTFAYSIRTLNFQNK